ncbi:MAG: DUF2797 domain-containing protein, partial [Arenicellales bacterium]
RLLDGVREFVDQLNEKSGTVKAKAAETETVCEIVYPVDTHPEKVKTHNFDKSPSVTGRLTGIKGQYLMMGDIVFNIRKFAGYEIEIDY